MGQRPVLVDRPAVRGAVPFGEHVQHVDQGAAGDRFQCVFAFIGPGELLGLGEELLGIGGSHPAHLRPDPFVPGHHLAERRARYRRAPDLAIDHCGLPGIRLERSEVGVLQHRIAGEVIREVLEFRFEHRTDIRDALVRRNPHQVRQRIAGQHGGELGRVAVSDVLDDLQVQRSAERRIEPLPERVVRHRRGHRFEGFGERADRPFQGRPGRRCHKLGRNFEERRLQPLRVAGQIGQHLAELAVGRQFDLGGGRCAAAVASAAAASGQGSTQGQRGHRESGESQKPAPVESGGSLVVHVHDACFLSEVCACACIPGLSP